MRHTLYSIRYTIYKLIATVFGIGYSPIAPGTLGSIAGLALCLAVHGNISSYIILFILLFAVGVPISNEVEKRGGRKDPSFIIIDEFACIFAVFLFVPLTWPVILIGFAVYRIIDITKIPPLKTLEKLPGGWAIMLDDLAAAIYANLVLQIIVRLVL
ncbi:MAG: phosphatidylglycerophosphatase A [Candidatus Aadella gelida]|nr:phosphatidylglycerophosphatase A [Candidatus Aadella gelida]